MLALEGAHRVLGGVGCVCANAVLGAPLCCTLCSDGELLTRNALREFSSLISHPACNKQDYHRFLLKFKILMRLCWRRVSEFNSPHFQCSSVHFTNSLFHVSKRSALILVKSLAPLRRSCNAHFNQCEVPLEWEVFAVALLSLLSLAEELVMGIPVCMRRMGPEKGRRTAGKRAAGASRSTEPGSFPGAPGRHQAL